jgi:hypothetical protein
VKQIGLWLVSVLLPLLPLPGLLLLPLLLPLVLLPLLLSLLLPQRVCCSCRNFSMLLPPLLLSLLLLSQVGLLTFAPRVLPLLLLLVDTSSSARQWRQ